MSIQHQLIFVQQELLFINVIYMDKSYFAKSKNILKTLILFASFLKTVIILPYYLDLDYVKDGTIEGLMHLMSLICQYP